MLSESELFIEGENKLGQYQVSVVRYSKTGWVPTVPPLNALVTNYRLILQPQTRRPYDPASIPATYITSVNDVDLDGRPVALVCLKTGHKLYFMTSWNQGEKFSESVKNMMTPTDTAFKAVLPPPDINRLIAFISRL